MSRASVETFASSTARSCLSSFHIPTNRLYIFLHLRTQKYCYQMSRSYICTYSLFGDQKTYFSPYVLQCSVDYRLVTIMGTLFILSSISSRRCIHMFRSFIKKLHQLSLISDNQYFLSETYKILSRCHILSCADFQNEEYI